MIAVGEAIVSTLWREIAGYEIPLPLPRMTYADAMARYGSDKPDLRFGLELTDLTGYFAGHRVPGVPGAVRRRGRDAGRRVADPRASSTAGRTGPRPAAPAGLAYALIGADGEISGPVGKNISESERSGLAAAVGAEPGDCVFFAAGAAHASQELLGAARLEIGHRGGLIDESRLVVPVGGGRPDVRGQTDERPAGRAVHHPFTSPLPEWADKLRDRARRRRSPTPTTWCCNGYEIGGGSIRIHRAGDAAGACST